jgi:hypothetical protein
MLAFINYETVKSLTILLFAILLFIAFFQSNTKKYKVTIAVIVPIFIIIILLEALNTQSNAQTNLQNFKNGSSFICKSNDNNQYKVSKKDGWSIDNNYFLKDSLLIRADKCKG